MVTRKQSQDNEEKKKNNLALGILIAVIALLFLLNIALVIRIVIPIEERSHAPSIVVYDTEGEWDEGHIVGVFDETIKPGSEGAYSFVVSNGEGYQLNYAMKLEHVYNGEVVEDFPMLYRLKMNNVALAPGTWVDIGQIVYSETVLPEASDQMFTLEWQWPFESGDDALDTWYGKNAGGYTIRITISASISMEGV